MQLVKIITLFAVCTLAGCTGDPAPAPDHAPASDNTRKPWAYWWWHGSSVTREGIKENLKAYSEAGIGGLHIVPIYGVEGDDENFIDYLSPGWMEMLIYTVSEATKLGMGIDMTTGTGWPFGGPGISHSYSAKKFELKRSGQWDTLTVEGNTAGTTGTTDGIVLLRDTGYTLVMKPTGQMVKRAAPGGEGLVIDYFNKDALDHYFRRFEDAFGKAHFTSGRVRAFYNDSYEVYHANITGDFPGEFRERRGYDLADHLPVMADSVRTYLQERIATDYCETISDLLYEEFAGNWVDKCHALGMLTRYQAHGSPGNLLDLYAVADIPETEVFGVNGFSFPGLRKDPDAPASWVPPDPLIMKFASSAAHVKAHKLVSSETATWLGGHFKVALSQVKPQVDELFTVGINHIIYHGITYNPPERPFPGRLYYASTNFGTRSHFWHELPALNHYIEQCQGILQNTEPLHDVLVYFPIHDIWARRAVGELAYLQVHNTPEWFDGTGFSTVVHQLWNRGFTFDYVSDRMLAEARVDNHSVSFEGRAHPGGGVHYRTIVVPSCKYMPAGTMQVLRDLAAKGARIIFHGALPDSVPGFYRYKERQKEMESLKAQIFPMISITTDLPDELLKSGIVNEELAEAGLRFIRKKGTGGVVYFVSNLSGRFHKGPIRLATRARYVEIFDPLTGKKGLAQSENRGGGTEILLQMEPGSSLFLFCHRKRPGGHLVQWSCEEVGETAPLTIGSAWRVTPVSGGPLLPEPVQIEKLVSWVQFGGDWETFGGKAIYTTHFELDPDYLGKPVRLQLGDVRETARVTVNGREMGLLWCIPYTVTLPPGTLQRNNTMEIEVTNLSFNRVKALEEAGVPWRNYYHTPFMSIEGKPYDISGKSYVASGLLDDIRLIPLKENL